MVVFDTQPDRRTERPRRPAVRRATGRRHRHQPGAEILPGHHHQTQRHHPGAHHRPVRGRRRPAHAATDVRYRTIRRTTHRAARPERRRLAFIRPPARPFPRWPRCACIRLHARPVPRTDGRGYLQTGFEAVGRGERGGVEGLRLPCVSAG